MMMRPCRFVFTTLFLSITLAIATGPLLVAVQQQATASAGQIQGWIAELSARRFIVREEATLLLVESGPAVIPLLVDSIAGQNVEGIARSIVVLQKLASSNDLGIESRARAALEKLGERENTAVGRKASRALVILDEQREEKSIRALRLLGAMISSEYVVIGTETQQMMTATIGDQWQGTLEDLQRLKWIRSIEHLALEGEKVTDEWMQHVKPIKTLASLALKRTRVTSTGAAQLNDHPSLMSLDVKYTPLDDDTLPHLANIKSLRFLKLYGTLVTVESALTFEADHVAVDVDHRMGAFLGVACPRAPELCFVRSVQSGTAAERAGIQAGDLIIEFNTEIVRSFDDLKRLISRHKPGEKTTIVVVRPGIPRSLSIKKTDELKLDLQLKNHAMGLEITGLEMKSAWYTSGLRQGDVISVFGNQAAKEKATVEEEFKMAIDTEFIDVVYYRKPNRKKSDVTFGEWK
jgi:hypothetical protein